MCVFSRVSGIKHLPISEENFFSVCATDSETWLSCRKSCRINFEYFDIQWWKRTHQHEDLGRLSMSFLLAFYTPRSWAWMTDCSFSPGNGLLRLNPKSSTDITKPGPAPLKNQAAGCRCDCSLTLMVKFTAERDFSVVSRSCQRQKHCKAVSFSKAAAHLTVPVHDSEMRQWLGWYTQISFWWQGRKRKCW